MRSQRIAGSAKLLNYLRGDLLRPGPGTYLLVLRLSHARSVTVGALGRLTLKPGFYVYVGSAMGGLAARLAHHYRARKDCHWHIDYLRQHARVRGAVAIAGRRRLECRLAGRIAQVAAWTVPGFGCSDCECRSHLFGFARDPLRDGRLWKSLRALPGRAYLVSSNPASRRASESGPTHTRNSPGSTVGR